MNEFDVEAFTWQHVRHSWRAGIRARPRDDRGPHRRALGRDGERRLSLSGSASPAALALTRPKAITRSRMVFLKAFVSAFEDSRGDIWMTAESQTIAARSMGAFDGPFSPLSGSRLAELVRGRLAYVEDRAGNVWVSSNRGLARHHDGRFTQSTLHKPPRPRVTGLHVDPRGRLWVGTQGAGLFRSDDPAAERPRFIAYSPAEHGLSSPTVWCVTDDGAGTIYVGTARGVDRLDPTAVDSSTSPLPTASPAAR